MKKDTILIVATVALLAAGVVFIILSLMGNDSQTHLPISLACITIANVLIMVRNRRKK